MKEIYTDVLIIGSGPSGLACASAISSVSSDFVLIDEGKVLSKRSHSKVFDISRGVGGVGLFSDGKFSFYPSGTNVYSLRKNFVEIAYKALASELKSIGISTPSFVAPKNNSKSALFNNKKIYPSIKVDLKQRKALADNIISRLSGTLIANTKALSVIKRDNEYVTSCIGEKNAFINIHSRSIVLSTGKCGTTSSLVESLSSFTELASSIQRFEFGLRIETDSTSAFFHKNAENDVKYIWNNGQGMEFRTFCTCRNGEVWNVSCGDMFSLSGRTDGIESNYSNFGFLVRYSENSLERGLSIWGHIQNRLRMARVSVQSLEDFLKGNSSVDARTKSRPSWFPANEYYFSTLSDELGIDLTTDLRYGFDKLVVNYPDLLEHETYCLFPAVEGVGYYPVINEELQLPKENIWVAGDIVGNFRGLVPAFISGHIAGLSVIQQSTSK